MNDLAIIRGDARRIPLADATVQCVVTSPPYWGLRKYAGAQDLIWGSANGCKHAWGGQIPLRGKTNLDTFFDAATGTPKKSPESIAASTPEGHGSVCELCGAWRGAYGLEPTIEMYVQHTVEILREIRRVLRRDGVVFWNIGDSYSSGGRDTYGTFREDTKQATHPAIKSAPRPPAQPGLKPKDLCLIPARVALAAQADGWWVRSNIIWAKPNPMPESVTDRPTDAYEDIIMLTKSERYFWDADAVRETGVKPNGFVNKQGPKSLSRGQAEAMGVKPSGNADAEYLLSNGMRNLRNVWIFPTQPYKGAHFATFPEEIPRRCILAATSERGACLTCGAPWERVAHTSYRNDTTTDGRAAVGNSTNGAENYGARTFASGVRTRRIDTTVGWTPGCKCLGQHGRTRPCLVLDPFGGSGTTARVAVELNRRAVSLDLAYHDHADRRTSGVQRRLPALA